MFVGVIFLVMFKIFGQLESVMLTFLPHIYNFVLFLGPNWIGSDSMKSANVSIQ